MKPLEIKKRREEREYISVILATDIFQDLILTLRCFITKYHIFFYLSIGLVSWSLLSLVLSQKQHP